MIDVAQPGNAPELTRLAAAIANAGMLDRYMCSLAYAADSSHANALDLLPGMNRRKLPTPIAARHLVRGGASLELVSSVTFRAALPTGVKVAMLSARTNSFYRAVRRSLRRRPSDLMVFQAGSGTFLESLPHEAIRTLVINQSIVCRQFINQEVSAQIGRYPDWTWDLERFVSDAQRLDSEAREMDKARVVLTQAPFQTRQAIKFYPNTMVYENPLGVTQPMVHSSMEPRRSIRQSSVVKIGFLGQASQRKGLADLINAVRLLKSSSNVQLIGVGVLDAPARPMLAKIGFVDWRGPLHGPALESFFDEIDLFCMPTLLEGFCLAPVEAMIRGVPTLVSERTAIGPHIAPGVDGWFAPLSDATALASALDEAISLPRESREAIGHAGAALAARFTWTAYRDRITRVLTELAEGT